MLNRGKEPTMMVVRATWASALRVRHLIQNAKVNVDRAYASPPAGTADTRQKRPAQIAFELDQAYNKHLRPSTHPLAPLAPSYAPQPMQPPREHQAYPVAHSVQTSPSGLQYAFTGYQSQPPGGLLRGAVSTPSTTPLPTFMPGYDSWWPDLEQDASAGVAPSPVSGIGPGTVGAGNVGGVGAQIGMGVGVPQGDFTFGQQHFSPEFLQAMRDPMLHFPSVFAHMYP